MRRVSWPPVYAFSEPPWTVGFPFLPGVLVCCCGPCASRFRFNALLQTFVITSGCDLLLPSRLLREVHQSTLLRHQHSTNNHATYSHLNQFSSSFWCSVWTSAATLTMSTYLHPLTCCHVIGWFDICLNEQVNIVINEVFICFCMFLGSYILCFHFFTVAVTLLCFGLCSYGLLMFFPVLRTWFVTEVRESWCVQPMH